MSGVFHATMLYFFYPADLYNSLIYENIYTYCYQRWVLSLLARKNSRMDAKSDWLSIKFGK